MFRSEHGLRVICAGLDNDPEKIGIHMLEMLAKFRNEGIVESTPPFRIMDFFSSGSTQTD